MSCDVRGRTIQFEEAAIGSEEERCTALAGAAAAAARGATDKNQFSLAKIDELLFVTFHLTRSSAEKADALRKVSTQTSASLKNR